MARPETDPCMARAIELGAETFVLHAQDYSAPKTVVLWIAENIDTAPAEKLREALECALRMRAFKGRKAAD